MEEEHLTTHDIVYQEGSPNKKVYTITPDGERHLIEWMIHTKSKPAKIKDEFLIKTSAFHVISKEEAISLLHRMKSHNEMVVTGTGQWKEQTFQGKKPGYEQVGEYLTAEYGIRYAQMYVDWCDWAIKEFNLFLKIRNLDTTMMGGRIDGCTYTFGNIRRRMLLVHVKPFDELPVYTDRFRLHGGHVKDPAYKEVKEGNSGHYEAVQITYDPDLFPYERLLEYIGHKSIQRMMAVNSRTVVTNTARPLFIMMKISGLQQKPQKKRSKKADGLKKTHRDGNSPCFHFLSC